jgi:hypothetical protein
MVARASGSWVELDVKARLNRREHLLFHELRVAAGHGVVFQAALAALRIASTVGNGDGDHGRHAMLGDEVIERGEEQRVWAVGSYDEGRGRAGEILPGDVYSHAPGVGRGVAGGDHELCRVVRIGLAEGAGVAGNARVELAVD